MTMHLAGIPVRDEAVLELARLVDDADLAAKLEGAYGRGAKILALDIAERETILAALDDPPPDLTELRGVLLRELEWRRAEGLKGTVQVLVRRASMPLAVPDPRDGLAGARPL